MVQAQFHMAAKQNATIGRRVRDTKRMLFWQSEYRKQDKVDTSICSET
jgi:hypothetical protein